MLKPIGRVSIDDYPCLIYSANKIVISSGGWGRFMAKKTFENALTRLEQITDELETGDLSLEKSLEKFNEGMAIGAAGFRVIEGMTSVVGALLYILLLALSQEFVKAGAPAASYFQTADAVINAGIGWFRDVAMLSTFGIGALMYYIVFYQYRLVPRWLTVWGLVGVTSTIISTMLVMFHVIAPLSTILIILQISIRLILK